MTELLGQLQKSYPQVSFCASEAFSWSPAESSIYYIDAHLAGPEGVWALLHEVGHSSLNHQIFHSDFELLTLEVAAWRQAKVIATGLGITIDDEHVEDCIDTYRDWLHRRSTCPTCGTICMQKNSKTYACHNCHSFWAVSSSRFCRSYRLKTYEITKTLPAMEPVAVFLHSRKRD